MAKGQTTDRELPRQSEFSMTFAIVEFAVSVVVTIIAGTFLSRNRRENELRAIADRRHHLG